MNKTFYSTDEETNETIINNYDVKLDGRGEFSFGNIGKNFKPNNVQIKPFLDNFIVFSNSIDNAMFEFYQNMLFTIEYSIQDKKYQIFEILKGQIDLKIEKIQYDKLNKNTVLVRNF